MAENSRGQNKNGQRNRTNSSDSPSNEQKVGNRRDTASGGLRDTNLDRMRNDNRTPKSSGLSAKRNISGTDYDGQLSDE